MVTPQFLSGSQLAVYSADVGATADAFEPATGALVITPATWDTAGLGPFNNGASWEGLEEMAALMFQGSHGLEDESRITLQGFMLTVPSFNATPQLLDMCWGGGITTTAPGAAQVGIYRLSPEPAALEAVSWYPDRD